MFNKGYLEKIKALTERVEALENEVKRLRTDFIVQEQKTAQGIRGMNFDDLMYEMMTGHARGEEENG